MRSISSPRPVPRPAVGAARLFLVAIAFAVALAGCGSGDDQTASGSSASAGGASTVTIADYLYKPGDITVPKGTTVKFTNEDSTPHTATSRDAGVFESGSIDTGKSASVTLEETGSFAYYCLFHPFMKGTITVE
jgi:plastocyanin